MWIAPARAESLRLVAFGDSLTAGLGLDQSDAYPAQLEKTLKAKGYDVAIANAGVSGDTASAAAQRIDWSVPDGTDGVIIALGGNDILRGIDPAITRKAMTDIIMRLKQRGIPVLLAGMQASANLGADFAKSFDAIFPELAGTRVSHCWSGFVAYTFDHMMHSGVHDGIHYAMGYCGSGVGMAGYLGSRVGRAAAGIDADLGAFSRIPFQSRPFYTGNPWFLAPSVAVYRLRDRLGI